MPVQVLARNPVPGAWPDPSPEHFQPVEESLCGWMKPSGGGLWTSGLLEEGDSGWIRWCLTEQFGGPEFDLWHLTPDSDAKVYTIDTHADLTALTERFAPICDHERPCREWGMGAGLSWRRVAEEYDAVQVTDEGQWATRHTRPGLYGWDCEATLWLRWVFSEVEHVGRRTFEREQAS